jgi:uncharacterized protein YndB with AHSA1/START domain
MVVALQPSQFSITRSATIAAPPETVFVLVNDLHKWEAWSPWAKLDPNAKNSYEGPPAGLGAALAWSGNKQVGEGRMTITESRPHELIRFQLEFLKPFKANHTAEFTFKLEHQHTTVTWNMAGHSNFISKAMGLFMNCDKMVGGRFEEGLAQMKLLAEAETKQRMAA